MKSYLRGLKQVVVSLVLLSGSTAAVAFPEIPFCPLGGPTGWWNRIIDDDHYYYPPPPHYPPPVAAPNRGPMSRYDYAPEGRYHPPPVHRY